MVPLCPFEIPFISPPPVFFHSPPHDAAPPPHILHVYLFFNTLLKGSPSVSPPRKRLASARLPTGFSRSSCAEGSVIMALLPPCSSPPSTPSYHPSIISSTPPLISLPPPLPLASSATSSPLPTSLSALGGGGGGVLEVPPGCHSGCSYSITVWQGGGGGPNLPPPTHPPT